MSYEIGKMFGNRFLGFYVWKTMKVEETPDEYRDRKPNRIDFCFLGKSFLIPIPFREGFSLSLEKRVFGDD